MAIANELSWDKDTAFHEFGPSTVQAEGMSGADYAMLVVGGRNATRAQELRDEGEDMPVVLIHACSLSGGADSLLRITPDSARELADALNSAADAAEREHEASGRTVDAILQGMARRWRKSTSRG